MKLFAKFFVLGIAALSLASCAETTNNSTEAPITVDENTPHRGGAMMMSFKGEQIAIEAANVIKLQKQELANEDDEAAKQIFNSLMTTEAAAMTDVALTMADEPVEDILVFGLDAESSKDITLQMYDEEGFALAANNTLQVNQGKNYRALNVQNLDNGNYTLILKDEDGKELRQKVAIQK